MSLLSLDAKNVLDVGASLLSRVTDSFSLNSTDSSAAENAGPAVVTGADSPRGSLVASVPLAGSPSDQTLSAPASIQNATLDLIYGGNPPSGIDPLIFDYDKVPRNSAVLGGRLGIVTGDPNAPGGANAYLPGMQPLGAFVALDNELSTINNLYRDAQNGMTDEQFRLGVTANEAAGKAASLLLPGMSSAGLEVVSEAVSFQVAGDNWAFRSMVGVLGAHEDFRQSGPSAAANYALLLGINHVALGQTAANFAQINLGGADAAARGANLMDGIIAYTNANKAPGVTIQAMMRDYLQQQFGMSAQDAQSFVSQFASTSAKLTRDTATQLISRNPPAR